MISSWKSLCIVCVVCVPLWEGVNGRELTELPAPDGKLNVYALPIGQGDCTIIQCPATRKRRHDDSVVESLLTVVDMGARSSRYMSEENVSNFLGNQKKNVEVVTISHPHEDHYNYIPKVLPITTLVALKGVYIGCMKGRYNGYSNDASTMRGWLSAAENLGKLKFADGYRCTTNCSAIQICGGRATLRILGANLAGFRCSYPNSNSLVLRLEYGKNFKVLFPGDFQDTSSGNNGGVQWDLINEWANHDGGIQADFYKLAHHGAYQGGSSSTTKANKDHFLQNVNPNYVFSSSAAPPNNYNHPHCGLYKRLKSIVRRRPTNPQAYYTCGHGSKQRKVKNNNFGFGIYTTSPEPNMPTIIHIATNGGTSSIEPVPYRST